MDNAAELAVSIDKRWPGTQMVGLDGPHRDDVLRAWSAALGDDAARREVDALITAPNSDVAQLARIRLFTGDPPAITTYQGRGSLAVFIRTIVSRIAIDQHRSERPTADEDVGSLVDHVAIDPALAHMRDRYAADLAGALRTAWDALAPHERFVLALELHQHLSIDQIARVYGIHRTSATRRLASARGSLVTAVRGALRAKLEVADATLDSILRLFTTSRRWAALAAIDEPAS